jgi:hypothetical protein
MTAPRKNFWFSATLVIARSEATKQSSLSFLAVLDCFDSLAMTICGSTNAGGEDIGYFALGKSGFESRL